MGGGGGGECGGECGGELVVRIYEHSYGRHGSPNFQKVTTLKRRSRLEKGKGLVK